MKEVVDKEGFFKDLYGKFRKTTDTEDFHEFCSLTTDEERVGFVLELVGRRQIEFPRFSNDGLKCGKRSLELKDSGNQLFQKEDNVGSLRLYNESILHFPRSGDKIDLAKIRANRSAALYYLQEYALALEDINVALASGYPKDLRYKILDRKSKCLLALKQHQAGLQALRQTLTALDDASLPMERRQKWQRDIQITVAVMVKNKVIDEKMSKGKESTDKMATVRHSFYRSASQQIEISDDSVQGRFAVAANEIEPGQVILKEEAHCSALLQQNAKSHCFHCLKRTIAGEPCNHCSLVKFCSLKCLDEALETHHSIECSSLSTFWKSGASVTCSLALRAISQRPVSHFLETKGKLTDKFNGKEYTSSDYSTVHALVRHERLRSNEDYFHRAFMAVFLLDCLRKSKYFDEITEKKDEAELFIGGLLLRNLQVLQFNAHEIFELQSLSEDLQKSKTVFIGAAVYPTLALFNHSCDPSIVRYFQNSKVIVRSIKLIRQGELIAENYGPIFTQTPREERRGTLKAQYWFDCECEPCSRNWPTLDQMSTDSLRFHCETTGCDNVLFVPSHTMDFMIPCGKCGQHTNILKGLKTLQDSDNVFRLGQSYLSTAQVDRASRKFLELQSLLGQTLVPPFKDYYLCLQGLRTCFVALGNAWPPLDKLKKMDERRVVSTGRS